MADVPTLDDVAARVGVSARTVSRVLHDEGGYSDATAKRVRTAVDELRYVPNRLAHSLRGPIADTIGVVGLGPTDPMFAALADAVQREAHDQGLTALCASSFGDPGTQRRILELFRAAGLQGAIVCPAPGTFDDIARVADHGFPTVVVGVDWTGPGVTSVVVGRSADGAPTDAAIARTALRALRRSTAEPDAVLSPISVEPDSGTTG